MQFKSKKGLIVITVVAAFAAGMITAGAVVAMEIEVTATGKVKTFDSVDLDTGQPVCTSGTNWVPMPGMSKAFNLDGRTADEVVVLFTAEFGHIDGDSPGTADIRLSIDGVPQTMLTPHAHQGSNVSTNGFNFTSRQLNPGSHTAAIEWKSRGGPQVCADARTMVVLHG